MAYGQFKPRQTTTIEAVEPTLTSEQMAAYIRQSSTGQVENNLESAGLQLSGAAKYAISQGLNADKIMIAHEGGGKHGVSGTLRIDQREELQEIVVGIQEGRIKLVWATNVNRLFRDPFGVQSGTFMELCAKHDVKVEIENAQLFDFRRDMDVMFFQLLVTMAAKENKERAKLMTAARLQKSNRGEYDGRPIPPGFTVDRSKVNAKGRPIAGKLIEYLPHSTVTRELYTTFRNLGGQFNMLAREVDSRKIVFPPFDATVSRLDIQRFQLTEVCEVHGRLFHDIKRKSGTIYGNHCNFSGDGCKLIGYHISRVGLMHLLQCIEYIGWWKVDNQILTDEHGTPIINHAAIVPYADWKYAFSKLALKNPDGSDNKERTHGHTWTPIRKSTKDMTGGILRGILVSPLGVVQHTEGCYRVVENKRVHDKPQASNTLTVPDSVIDSAFQERLMERVREMWRRGKGCDFLNEQLQLIKVNNARALISVDEQLAGYRNQKAGIDNFIKAVGASASQATLIEKNAELLEIEANINDLEAKQKSAAAEESGIMELIDRIQQVTGDGFHSTEESRRFIRLATKSISLDEYSPHFLTLTIVWKVPFSQVDTCYIYRQAGASQEWTTEDNADLATLFPTADRLTILQRFDSRTWKSIFTWAYRKGLRRDRGSANSAGHINDNISLGDYQLLESLEWNVPAGKYSHKWVYNASDFVDTLSAPGLHR